MSATESKRPIGDILLEKGLISPEELDKALAEQRESGGLLGEVLVDLGIIGRLELASALGSQWGRSLTGPRPANHTGPPTPSTHDELAALRLEVTELRATVARLDNARIEHDDRLTLLTQLVLHDAS